MTEAAPDDVTLEESGRSERGISAEDSMAAMKAQLGVALGTRQQRVADRNGGGGALGPASLYAASPMLCSG